MNDSQEHQLIPAAGCIWFVLATIAGEATLTHNVDEADATMRLNQYYWNGLMRERMLLTRGFFEARLGSNINFPTLTDADHDVIRAALDARNFKGAPIPYYQSTIDFSRVDFPNSTWFHGFVFGGRTDFAGARFNGPSNVFTNVVFGGDVAFDRTEFRGRFFSDGTNFVTASSFRQAQFRNEAWFSRCKFHTRADFGSAQFSGESHFDNCEFSDVASFLDATFDKRIDFRVAHFRGRTNFEKAKFKAVVPEFFGATFNEHTEWHEAEWPEIPSTADDRRDQITRYQCLARSMNELEKFSDQHFFFGKELQIQRQVERWSVARPMNWAYQFLCGYGYGLTRLAAIWLAHMVVGAVLLCLAKIFAQMDEETLWQATRTALSDFHLAFALSFGNSHGPLGLNGTFFAEAIKDWPWYQVIGPVQTVLGVIILFFLLLTIRNRFRMR